MSLENNKCGFGRLLSPQAGAKHRGGFGNRGTKDDNDDGNQWQMPALGDREEPGASRGTGRLGGARADSTAGLEGSADK